LLRVALSSFRQLYDLLGDWRLGSGNWPVRMLEGHQGHLESDAQEAGGLGVKPVALQVVPDRHGRYARFNRQKPNRKYAAVKWLS
jgi:hypothetical protein